MCCQQTGTQVVTWVGTNVYSLQLQPHPILLLGWNCTAAANNSSKNNQHKSEAFFIIIILTGYNYFSDLYFESNMLVL